MLSKKLLGFPLVFFTTIALTIDPDFINFLNNTNNVDNYIDNRIKNIGFLCLSRNIKRHLPNNNRKIYNITNDFELYNSLLNDAISSVTNFLKISPQIIPCNSSGNTACNILLKKITSFVSNRNRKHYD
mgnify:CR=1 FL=1